MWGSEGLILGRIEKKILPARFLFVWTLVFGFVVDSVQPVDYGRLFTESFDPLANRFPSWKQVDLDNYRDITREMFTFGWDNYMTHAFPLDELDPIHCTGRGPDYDNPSNININDVLGDYCLTLVDALDTHVVLGNKSEFHRAVRLVTEFVSFDKDITVQVFEATIRVLGSLLSAHILLIDKRHVLGDFTMPDYNNELLTLAHDLASRLLPAFEHTVTGLPHPRVNLMYGVPWDGALVNETCTSGAGSLLLEFGVLSRLLNDPTYEGLARRTNKALWALRDLDTGLLGNTINIQTGEWLGLFSGLGAGLDSFYEYLLKAYILFGNVDDYHMFNASYSLIRDNMRRGRPRCNSGAGDPPLYVNVHMRDGSTANTWIDSLQASFAGVQILEGDLEEAICQHALYYSIWQKYGLLPERYNWKLKAPDVAFYPLRPEFAESTYLLYQATRNPFYLHVGAEIVDSLNEHTRAECGFATVHNVHDKSLEDRMESFFLSETCKYLFLLFDTSNPVNRHYDRLVFTTEGHILPISVNWRHWHDAANSPKTTPSKSKHTAYSTRFDDRTTVDENGEDNETKGDSEFDDAEYAKMFDFNDDRFSLRTGTIDYSWSKRQHRTEVDPPLNRTAIDQASCSEAQTLSQRFMLPLKSRYLQQLFDMIGIDASGVWI